MFELCTHIGVKMVAVRWADQADSHIEPRGRACTSVQQPDIYIYIYQHSFRLERILSDCKSRDAALAKELADWRLWWHKHGVDSDPQVMPHMSAKPTRTPQVGIQTDMLAYKQPLREPRQSMVSMSEDAFQEVMAVACERAMSKVIAKLERTFEARMESLVASLQSTRADASSVRQELDDARARIDLVEAELQDMECRADSCGDYDDSMLFSGGLLARSPTTTRTQPCGGEGSHRNDLGLPVDTFGATRWESLSGVSELEQLRQADQQGLLTCQICRTSIASMTGNYGNIYIIDDNNLRETKNFLAFLGDWPTYVRCFRCHLNAVPCRFWNHVFVYAGLLLVVLA